MQLPTGSAVLATSHPDATAFAARFLANPEDRLGRLVFADWLEERGDDSSMAWAQYLRCMAQAEVESDSDIIRRAEVVGRAVRARLTLGRVPGTPLLSRLTAFLPDHCISVRIGSARVPQEATDNCQGYFALYHRFMPIGMIDEQLFVVATAEPFEMFRRDVESFLCCRVTAFRGDWMDVNRAIAAHYGDATVCPSAGMLDD